MFTKNLTEKDVLDEIAKKKYLSYVIAAVAQVLFSFYYSVCIER